MENQAILIAIYEETNYIQNQKLPEMKTRSD
jgi:hypothetical protein